MSEQESHPKTEGSENNPHQDHQTPRTEVNADQVTNADVEKVKGVGDEATGQISAEQTADSSATIAEDSLSDSQASVQPSSASSTSGGPINLERIRQLRLQQQNAAKAPKRGPRPHQNRSHSTESPSNEASSSDTANPPGAPQSPGAAQPSGAKEQKRKSRIEVGVLQTPPQVMPKVAVPSRRGPLSEDLEQELNQVLSGDLDLDKVLVGDESLQVGHQLSEGQRIQAIVLKLHEENVFVSLGGPNEGVLSILQFDNPPAPGAQLEVLVRGFLPDEGLYELTLPGSAVDVSDWSEIKEGEVVEALVTGSNSGGLDCKVGSIRGFIPASQIAPYRVENLNEYVGQKVLCLISEANQRRGNLILSRRSVLEREREEQRAQKLAALEPGTAVTGTVRKITNFGAFVDIGGLDGLLHISQLSWERINHPSELLQEGQQIQVRVDKVDAQTGKISLSYRSLQEHPWTNVQVRFPVGSVVKGTVSRLAEFGAFVKLATGVEGLVHLSEIAHYRVQRVSSVLKQDQEVEVKILSVDEEKQRISLSIKAAQQSSSAADEAAEAEDAEQELPSTRKASKRDQPLKGGMGTSSGGERFGLKW